MKTAFLLLAASFAPLCHAAPDMRLMLDAPGPGYRLMAGQGVSGQVILEEYKPAPKFDPAPALPVENQWTIPDSREQKRP